MTDFEIEVSGEQLILMPERAAYWRRTSTLFITDTHWGKAATFRAHAIPIPEGNTTADLARLSAALRRTHAEKLIILGDLVHGYTGYTPQLFAQISAWRAQHPDLDIYLVRGNHDHAAGDPPTAWRIRPVDAPTPGPNFVLLHEPPLAPVDGYALAGHLHPAVQLTGAGRQSLKLPCFWFRGDSAVLPAFGSFIGMAVVTPQVGDRVYVATDASVIRMA
jgi:DNA ligase-associated metallophosphoesterase